MKIFLIGYMGCGKSTIGRMLAQRLGFGFLDMDSEVERISGMTVGELFSARGEDEFRRLEREVLARVAGRDGNLVVATGGGVPCFFDNMEVMNRSGLTVYFKMSPEKLASRLERGKRKRPLLRDKSAEELTGFIRENLGRREARYAEAKLVIDGDGVTDEYIAGHVQRWIENRA